MTTASLRPDPILDAIVELTSTAMPAAESSPLDRNSATVIDTLGVAIAGSRDADATAVRDAMLDLTDGSGSATIVGASVRTAPLEAALVNGVAAHALTMDVSLEGAMTHPSCHLVPALLAAAELSIERDSWDRLVKAHAVGVEIEARLSAMLNPEHARSGWHATATLGTVATAAAVACFLGLGRSRTAQAVALAASSASGLRASIKSPVKYLHAGGAARSGLEAAFLASHGLVGSDSPFVHEFGFIRAFSGRYVEDDDLRLWNVSEMRTCPAVQRLALKPYPCATPATSAVEAASIVGRELGLRTVADAPAAVRLRLPKGVHDALKVSTPHTSEEARFSIRHCVARALITGGLTPEDFLAEALRDRRTGKLRADLDVIVDDDLGGSSALVEMELVDGRRSVALVEAPTGSPQRELTSDFVRSKFLANVTPSLGEERAQQVFTLVTSDDVVPLDKVLSLLGSPA